MKSIKFSSMKEEITEGNKLIAEFMVHKHFDSIKGNDVWYWTPNEGTINEPDYYEKLKYNASWDWLMPVYDKFHDLGWSATIDPWAIEFIDYKEGDEEEVLCYEKDHEISKIKNYWYAIVELIKIYNKKKRLELQHF